MGGSVEYGQDNGERGQKYPPQSAVHVPDEGAAPVASRTAKSSTPTPVGRSSLSDPAGGTTRQGLSTDHYPIATPEGRQPVADGSKGVLKILCGWCGFSMGETQVAANDPSAGQTSHGMCPYCMEEFLAGFGKWGALLLLIPTLLLGGCIRDDEPSWKEAYRPHFATAWTVTPGGILRDAGPFKSVDAGYTTDEEIDAALDWARADFQARFPEYTWVNPPVHLTDDYFFWVSQGDQFAAGATYGDSIALALWTRATGASDPEIDAWIVRPPGMGNSYWRWTARRLVPAYQHEALHIAIGDPTHSSSLWGRL